MQDDDSVFTVTARDDGMFDLRVNGTVVMISTQQGIADTLTDPLRLHMLTATTSIRLADDDVPGDD